MKKILLTSCVSLLCGLGCQGADGDVFTAQTSEGIQMTFKVISEQEKTCAVGIDKWVVTGDNYPPTGDDIESIAIDYHTEGVLTIPAEANGYKVVRVGVAAFAMCENLTEVVIPEGVEEIGELAFFTCKQLQRATFPESVRKVEPSVFSDCVALREATLPKGMTEVPDGYLSNCQSLPSFTIPEGVTKVSRSALQWCRSLTTLTIPEGVTTLAESCLQHCEALRTITLPATLRRIENGVFTSCQQLQAIHLPEGIEYMGDFIFWDCTSLTSFAFPSTLTHIGTFLLASDANITSVYSYLPTPIELGDFGNTQTFTMLPGAPTGQCVLYVPEGTADAYRAAPGWNDFKDIREFDATAIPLSPLSPLRSSNSTQYHINGVRQHVGPRGILIERMPNGTAVKKVL